MEAIDWSHSKRLEAQHPVQRWDCQCCCNRLGVLREAVWRKKSEYFKLGVIHHDSATPYTAQLAKQSFVQIGWEVLQHSPYSLDLVLMDFKFWLYQKVCCWESDKLAKCTWWFLLHQGVWALVFPMMNTSTEADSMLKSNVRIFYIIRFLCSCSIFTKTRNQLVTEYSFLFIDRSPICFS
jgi:hypothetical protein